MRARYPDTEGFVERDGVKVGYEVFGSGEPALVFAPTDPLVHSRVWKAQVPYLARTSRVVTIDPRGNGRSDRPRSSAAYADTEYVADTIAVMDAVGADRAVLDELRPEHRAQPADHGRDVLLGGGGTLVRPEHLDDPVDRDQARPLDREQLEQRPRLPAADLAVDQLGAVPDDPEVPARRSPTCATLTDPAGPDLPTCTSYRRRSPRASAASAATRAVA
jgi:hypothetical protein